MKNLKLRSEQKFDAQLENHENRGACFLDTGGGGGGSAPPPPAAPDYSPIAASNEAAAKYAKEAADNDLAFRKTVYEESKPGQTRLQDLAKQVADAQLGYMGDQSKMAKDQNEYYGKTFKPLEQQVAMESMGAMDMSDADVASLADRLGIDPAQAASMLGLAKRSTESQATQAQTMAQAQANNAYGQGLRALTRSGGDPRRLAAAAAGMAGRQTLAGVGAANNARNQAKAQGMSLRAGATAFGRNMPNTAGQMYGLAGNSGNAAVGNANTGFMSGLPYAQFAAGGYGSQMGAAGLQQQGALGMGGLMSRDYGTAMSGYGSQLNYMGNQGGGADPFGQMLGMGVGAFMGGAGGAAGKKWFG